MSRTVTANVVITMELQDLCTWSDTTNMKQIIEQAKEMAESRVRKMAGHDGKARFISCGAVTVKAVEEK
jgi:hypothetical protein